MFIKPNIEKLDETDLRIKAWNISRPQLPDVDDIGEIENIDLSLNELKTYYFDITSSVLFRELILSIRPISVWATTSRNIPLTDVKISDEYKSNKAISEFSILCLQSALTSDKHQDIARMELPITSSTRYVIGINHRTLVAFLKTLKIHSEFLYNIYGVMLFQQANLINLKEYSYGDLSSSVVPSDTEVLADYGTSSFLDMSITKAPLAVSLVAQMVRHQRNTIKNSLWEIAKDPSLHSITLGDEVDIIMYVPRSSYEGMVKHRTFCFTGDTKVSLLNGTTPSFNELLNIYGLDTTFDIMSCSKHGNLKPSKARNLGITGYVSELVEVTLDNNKVVKCTKDHQWLMKDGTFKRAEELCINDSLMPYYIRVNEDNPRLSGYKVLGVKVIKLDNNIPVYDIEVLDDNHTFPLEAGVFVHNCTIADPVLWNNFNKVALSTIPKEDFVKNTPCKCNPSKCAFLKDSLGRVELHDPGLPCPILLESPSIIEDMKKIYGDDVMTVRVMEHLVSKKAIKDNPDNELRVMYENNLKNKV